MPQPRRAEVEEIEQLQDVRAALAQTVTGKAAETPQAATKDKLWFGSYLLLVVGLAMNLGIGYGLYQRTLNES